MKWRCFIKINTRYVNGHIDGAQIVQVRVFQDTCDRLSPSSLNNNNKQQQLEVEVADYMIHITLISFSLSVVLWIFCICTIL
jgi:hypothetical protein